MPKLQTKPQRKYRYEMIAKAEGEQCLACYMESGKRRGPPKTVLQIDHADNDDTNWSWGNIHLLCRNHNCKYRGQNHIRLFQSYSDQLERERERENFPTWKTVLKDEIPYDNASAEMQANKIYEPRWKRYVHKTVREQGSPMKKEIISGGAAYSHCSIQTSTNYLTKYTSPISPFKETTDEDGNKVIVYREDRIKKMITLPKPKTEKPPPDKLG
jgi:hypothetical protein